MSQVDFYILENDDHNGKLKYACRIAQKAYGQGLKVLLRTTDSNQSSKLDAMLWTFSQSSFIPHVISNNADMSWHDYPVQLCDDPSRINSEDANTPADIVINLGSEPALTQARIAELVCNDPQDKQSGRDRFRAYREQGLEPSTHRIN